MGKGESTTHNAAVTCANRPPPSSRAINPVTTTAVADAMTENSRSPTIESPKIERLTRSTTGVNGGYATNPQSRCRASLRNCNSSR
jgi:hypothetical protein